MTAAAEPQLEIRLPDDRDAFLPGETIDVESRWWLPEPMGEIELRLVWHTSGTGNRDLEVVEAHSLGEAQQGTRTTRLRLPDRPHSFSGQLITLSWSIELVVDDGRASTRHDIVVAPGRREIRLQAIEAVNENDERTGA